MAPAQASLSAADGNSEYALDLQAQRLSAISPACFDAVRCGVWRLCCTQAAYARLVCPFSRITSWVISTWSCLCVRVWRSPPLPPLCAPACGQFPKLRSLDLSWNLLDSIHELDSLRQLRELKLHRNKLTTCDGLSA